MSLRCFYSRRQVERSEWVSVWVGVRKKKKKNLLQASEGMFQAHGGLFILKAVKCISSGGGGIYKVTLLRRMGFTKWYCMSAMCDLQKASTRALNIRQEQGSSDKKDRASNTDPPPKSRLTIYHFIVPSLSLFWNVFLVINLQNRHSWARSLPI